MLVKNTTYFFLVLILGFAFGCKKDPNYGKEPIIEFDNLKVKPVTYVDDQNITQQVDSLWITIRFKDGDGDLGNDPVGKADYDYISDIYKKINGIYKRVDYFDTIKPNYNANLPLLSPYTLTGPIDGMITNILPDLPAPLPGHPYKTKFPFKKNDTLQFHIRIRDRAGNYSNWVQSTEYIVWKTF